jgi:hypothetical protein
MGRFEYSASFLVALFKGSQILAKSLMSVLKKFHSPTKDLISYFVCGIFAVSAAFSMPCPV